MRRFHFIEIEDQAWGPTSLRDAVVDVLQFTFNALGLYNSVVPHLKRALDMLGTQYVLDLCSGGGGPWLGLQRVLEGELNRPVVVRLTDKYPNLAAFRRLSRISEGALTFCPDPVDARSVPPEHKGFRTLFTSFHHFRPNEARAILQAAVQSDEGIGVFEVPQCRPVTILLTLLMPIAALGFAPFLRPFRWSRLLWTFLFPAVPFVLLFDGIVSCFRAYSPSQLRELTDKVAGANYRWEVGEVRTHILPISVTYLIGWPDARTTGGRSPGRAERAAVVINSFF